MLSQNFKGLLTLVFIFSLLIGGFYVYKNILEPKYINSDVTQFPVTTDMEINPKIEISATSVSITFETPYETNAAVQYCLKEQYNNCKETAQEQNKKMHKISVTNLKAATEYDYKIVIDDKYYPAEEKSYFKFTTKNDATQTKIDENTPIVTIKSTLTKDNNKIVVAPTSSTIKKPTLQEFKAAMTKQDLKYDTDKDGKVTIKDFNP